MIRHFDFLAPVYDFLVRPPDTARWRDVLRLPTPGSMLDCGGGTARLTHRLRPLVGSLVVTDLSFPMLRGAKAKGDLWPVQAHAETLPFPDEHFDRVVVVDALHHFCDPWQAISEVVRVLRRGGRLIIEEPDIKHALVRVAALLEKLTLMRSRFYSPKEIQDGIGAYGLSSRIERGGAFAAWIIADKPAL